MADTEIRLATSYHTSDVGYGVSERTNLRGYMRSAIMEGQLIKYTTVNLVL